MVIQTFEDKGNGVLAIPATLGTNMNDLRSLLEAARDKAEPVAFVYGPNHESHVRHKLITSVRCDEKVQEQYSGRMLVDVHRFVTKITLTTVDC